MAKGMDRIQAKEGLNHLADYISQYGFRGVLVEEEQGAQMDSLLIPLRIGDDLSIDISCNYFYVPEIGNMLQFYGQFTIDGLMEEKLLSAEDIRMLANEINPRLPVGQIFYMDKTGSENGESALGIRYTMLVQLEQQPELEKCVSVLMLLMQIYEFLCSVLVILIDGKPVDEAIRVVDEVLHTL